LSLGRSLARALAEGRKRERGPVAIGGELAVDPDVGLCHASAPWCFWDTRSTALASELVLGLGAYAALTASGETRYDDVARESKALFARLRTVGAGPSPRVFGGFSFAPRGDAHFVLPRLTLENGHALLMLDESELERGAAILEELLAPAADAGEHTPYVVDDGSARYLAAVRRALDVIGAGVVEKVVTARKVRIADAPDARVTLAALAETPGSTRLGLCTSNGAFIAATPELLCAVSHDRIATEAVAGTIPAGLPARDLSGSEKDVREHRLVKSGIHEALAQLGLEPTEAPVEVRVLRHVQHLVTPIRAPRPSGLHVLDVVRALHPTPAVGGVPRDRALRFLDEIEPEGRGPYAGPFGWLDADGNGTFVVGIRSALFRKREADVFAGGGIVAGSDPERELRETDWKLRALFGALGASA
jgi:menaquinone-specific isochorismate synthase